MKAAVDLHIHSALSPCADNDMSPNNIVNMALLKGLDIIALTDHNTALNCEAVMKCAKGRDIIVIPGMEVETREEVHLICLFSGLQEALKLQELVQAALPDIPLREDIFGQQLLMNHEDQVLGSYGRLLVTAVSLGVDEVFHIVQSLGGVVIPAHIDRDSYSIISNLGLIPENLDINYMELSKSCDRADFISKHKHLKDYNYIKSSDAHYLWDILERESFLELEELSGECLIKTLKG